MRTGPILRIVMVNKEKIPYINSQREVTKRTLYDKLFMEKFPYINENYQ